jgi:hypothetical protein
MASQLETLRLLAPEFAAVNDTLVLQFLGLAGLHMNPEAFPENVRGLALVYKAASLLHDRGLTSSGVNTSAFVTSEKEGDLERTYKELRGASSLSLRNGYEQKLSELFPQFGMMVTRFGLNPGS